MRKKKPHRFEEGMAEMKDWFPRAFAYLQKVGKKNLGDRNEQPALHKWALCEDGGYRWGIMTSISSDLSKNVFKDDWRIPVMNIVEMTFCKCMSLFKVRRPNVTNLISTGKAWPDRITRILQKRGCKAERYEVNPCALDRNKYEVIVKGKRTRKGSLKDFKYTVRIEMGAPPQCDCRTPKLTCIPCSHVLAVCSYSRLDAKKFVHPYYSVKALYDTWSSQFHMYRDFTEWPKYGVAVIIPDRTLVRRGPSGHGKNTGKKQASSSINNLAGSLINL